MWSRWSVVAASVLGALWGGAVLAQTTAPSTDVTAWLLRMNAASRQRAYMGTFVVSAGTKTASAKIWHVCDGTQQMERIESLSGPAKSTFRRNAEVVTFFPAAGVVVQERRESLGDFPNLLKPNHAAVADLYQIKLHAPERVAGLEADVVTLWPVDAWRYGYKIWSERQSGLVLQLQTLDATGQPIEQAAFSELQMDAPVNMSRLEQLMANTAGYRVEHVELQKTTLEAQGWTQQGSPVAGFQSTGCYRRGAASPVGTVQCGFSDGLATVSLFVEPYEPRRHAHEGVWDWGGATRVQTLRQDAWWITGVGEVPVATLNVFVRALVRKK